MATFPPPSEATIAECLALYEKERHTIGIFTNGVEDFLATHPKLTSGDLPAVHSSKARVKNVEHLRKKIIRKKVRENREITAANLFTQVTDLGGVRIFHLHKEQFGKIHSVITNHVGEGHWALQEPPKAYTWDPEYKKFFDDFGLTPEIKDSNYTSVHYLVKPNAASPLCCEIQVRTLFEEVWGEIEHVLNYPDPTKSVACSEQLRVLAKMVGAGSRLADAIFRSYKEFTDSAERPQA